MRNSSLERPKALEELAVKNTRRIADTHRTVNISKDRVFERHTLIVFPRCRGVNSTQSGQASCVLLSSSGTASVMETLKHHLNYFDANQQLKILIVLIKSWS